MISQPLPIGFPFPFYGATFTSLRVASNGFLSFTHADAPYENQPLPSPGAPRNLVAGFWEDLVVPGSQSVVWLAEPHAFTVQYDGVLRYGGGGPYTFQIVLFDTGEIEFLYLSMPDPVDSATIGIQDANGTSGLQVANDAPYLHDRLAVRIAIQKEWLSAAPSSGRLRTGESAPVTLTWNASGLAAGTYEARLPILTNDPDRPRLEHPALLTVADAAGIAVDPPAVDFGRVFAGYGSRRSLDILSTGSLPLTVSAARPDDPAITSDFAPFVLPPGESRRLSLDWIPGAPATLFATLRIESDATNASTVAVPLGGTAVGPPVLEVDPEVLEETVPPGGATERTLVLGNDGPTDLDYQMTIGRAAGLSAGSFGLLPPSPEPLTCVVADPTAGALYGQARRGRNFYRLRLRDQAWETLDPSPLASGVNCGAAILHGSLYTSSSESTGRIGVYDTTLGSWTTIPHPLGVASALIASDGDRWLYVALGASVKRFEPVAGGVVESLPAPPFLFDRWGGLVADRGLVYGHSGNGATWFVRYDPFLRHWSVLPALPLGGTAGAAIDPVSGDYFFCGPPGGSSLARFDSKNGLWSVVSLPFPVEDGGLAWLGQPAGALFFVEGERGNHLGRLLLADAASATATGPTSGRIPPGGRADIGLRFDALGLTGGLYESDITLKSNDPASPVRVVPARLTIPGTPSLRVRGEPVLVRSTLPYTSRSAETTHLLHTPLAPSGDGTLRLIAEGDFGDATESASVVAEGTALGTAGATGIDCSAAVGLFPVPAATLAALALDGTVGVSVRNSGDVEPTCERSQHTVELSYRTAADRLDFGTHYIGQATSLRLELENAGNGTLQVTAASTSPEFVPETGALALAPGERAFLGVEFRSVAEGSFTSDLVLSSNDPAAPTVSIPMAGRAGRPPHLVVSPSSFDETLAGDGDVTRTLRIGNDGGLPLTFSLSTRVRPSGSSACVPSEALVAEQATGVLTRVNLEGTNLSSRVTYLPGPGRSLATAFSGTLAFALQGSPGTVAAIDLALGSKTASILGASSAIAVAASSDTLFAIQPGGRVVARRLSGGLLETVASGLNQPSQIAVTVDGRAVYVLEPVAGRLLRIVRPEGHSEVVASGLPAVSGLALDEPRGRALVTTTSGDVTAIDVVTGAIATLASGFDGPVGLAPLSARDILVLEGASGRLTRADVVTGGRTIVLAGLAGPIALAAIPPAGCTDPFVSLSPVTGAVEAGAPDAIAVTFDPGRNASGSYDDEILIQSNDPTTPSLTLPARLTIDGDPDLDVAMERPAVSSEAFFTSPGATTSHYFPLPDPRPVAGEIELEAAGLFDDPGQDATLLTSGTILSLGATGRGCATVSLRRDLPDADLQPALGTTLVAQVRNSSAVDAHCDVNRHRVTVRLFTHEDRLDFGPIVERAESKRDLLVLNRGRRMLTVIDAASDGPEATVSPASFRVPAGGRRRVTVTVRPAAAGPAGGRIDLRSDDPDTPVLAIPWVAEAKPAPSLVLTPESIDASLFSQEERPVTLTLANRGGLDLHYSIAADPVAAAWLRFTADSGAVPPGGERQYTATLSAASVPPGTYAAFVTVASDDPSRPQVRIPVTMVHTEAPHIVLDSFTGTRTSSRSFFQDGAETEHLFPVSPQALQSATFAVTVIGDFDGAGETADFLVDGNPIGTLSFGGTPCGQHTLSRTLAGPALRDAAADGILRVTVKNTAAVQASCPVNRHTVKLTTISLPAAIDFGSVRPGDLVRRELRVRNDGLGRLTLQGVSTDGGAFTAFPAADAQVVLGQGDAVNLPIDFVPPSLGTQAGTLFLDSDDRLRPSIALPLRGEGIGLPLARLEENALDLVAPPVVRTTTSVKLFNGGDADLIWRIDQRAGPAPASGSPEAGRIDDLPSSPVSLSGLVGDPDSGTVYGVQSQGPGFYRLPPRGQWTGLAPAPIIANGAGAALLNGKIYLSGVNQNLIGIYDIARDAWTSILAPPGIVGGVIASDGRQFLYLAFANAFVRFDPVSGAVLPLAPFPGGMSLLGGMAYCDGAIYAHRGGTQPVFARFDITESAWTSLPGPPVLPLLGAVFDPNSREYLTYGPDSGHLIVRFSVDTEQWTTTPLADHTLAVGGIAWIPGPIPGAVVVQGRAGLRATRFDGDPPLVRAGLAGGTVPPGGSVRVPVIIQAGLRPPGEYADRFVFATDGPDATELELPIRVTVSPDRDLDGVLDADDNCPAVANPAQTDSDADGPGDACDDCPEIADPAQEDADRDGIGDACDGCPDTDHDGFGGPGPLPATCPMDNCPTISNLDQKDDDGDGLGDACDPCRDPDHDGTADVDNLLRSCPIDNCPGVANPGQENADLDRLGDVCDPCPSDPLPDLDGDGLCQDNCPTVANPLQEDSDGDGLGDACDLCPRDPDPGQADTDGDRIGDACDLCPLVPDPAQRDADGDRLG
ncbi:MAG TPA: choice-of-anchor D domain-containing protein, partial [Candidatus Polarisedimenticolia bacterium]|nr:choice-of-anchor D domain-containing protein [Candidatus Polarisedimenticolia bacterium]